MESVPRPSDPPAAGDAPPAAPRPAGRAPLRAAATPLGDGGVPVEDAPSAPDPGDRPDLPPRLPPAPREGGPLVLLRFLRANGFLRPRYVPYAWRLARAKLRFGRRLRCDGIVFLGRDVELEIGRDAVVHLGRWSWLGHGTKIRCHEGEVRIGSRTVLGQEVTVSAYESVVIGRECIVADRTMFIDFDHSVAWTETPVRAQGIYKRPVRVGHNVWVGYGACVLRGASVGDNAVLGTYAVVSRDVPENAVAGGIPAKVLRMRERPRHLRWED